MKLEEIFECRLNVNEWNRIKCTHTQEDGSWQRETFEKKKRWRRIVWRKTIIKIIFSWTYWRMASIYTVDGLWNGWFYQPKEGNQRATTTTTTSHEKMSSFNNCCFALVRLNKQTSSRGRRKPERNRSLITLISVYVCVRVCWCLRVHMSVYRVH